MSRLISDLHPKVADLCNQFVASCQQSGIDSLIISTYRSIEEQNLLYAQGRTTPGNPCLCGGHPNPIGTCQQHPRGLHVTNAKGGESMHNYRLAFDFVPLIHGKPAWQNEALFARCASIGESLGLEWAGRWKTFHEQGHLQFTSGLTLAQLKAGETLPA